MRWCLRIICKACAHEGRKNLSIHSVKSAGTVLEILEEKKVFESCRCVFHWFTCSKTEFKKAVENGSYFSVNSQMVKTNKGQKLIRNIPAEKILLETDAPFAKRITSIQALKNELLDLTNAISTIRGEDVKKYIEHNTMEVLFSK